MRRPVACAVLLATVVLSCDREARRYRDTAPPPGAITQSSVHAGQPPPYPAAPAPYQDNAWAVSEGKLLFSSFNCSGCHANGGGGMGPALMDDRWIYGSSPSNIYQTILEGRPNGMPSFRGKIAGNDVWKLVAFVRALGALTRIDVPSARGDHMRATPPLPTRDRQQPVRQEAEHP